MFEKHKGELVSLVSDTGKSVYGYLFREEGDYIVLDKPVFINVRETVGVADLAAIIGSAAELLSELLVNAVDAAINRNQVLMRTSKETWIQAFRNQMTQYIQQTTLPIPINLAPLVSGIENEGMAGKNLAYFPKNKFIFVPVEHLLTSGQENIEENRKPIEELKKLVEDAYSPKKLEEYKRLIETFQKQLVINENRERISGSEN